MDPPFPTRADVAITELAGVFWLWAEVAILAFVLALRRSLAAHLSQRLPRQRLTVAVAAAVALVSLPPLRHLFHPTPPSPSTYLPWITSHHGLWILYAVLWVLLEALIVYHGIQAFRLAHRHITGPGGAQ